MDQLEQYALDLHQEVVSKAGSDENPLLREEAFTDCVSGVLVDHNATDDVEVCSHYAESHGRMPAAKLNAWAMTGDAATLDLFVARYFGTGQIEEVGKPETRRHFQLLRSFLRRALEGFHTKTEESSDAFQVMQRIHEARESLATVRLFFLTDGCVRTLDDLEAEAFDDIEVQHIVWDLDKLSRLRVDARQAIELDFVNDYGGPLSCIQTADPTGEYRTFLAFIPGPLVARIYGEYGQRLLERNVRAFLQAKGKVNRGLQKTLKEEPSRFLAYNNGLCCTAAEVEVESGSDGHGRLKSVKDFQIVNGGQTTASIFHAVKKEKLPVDQVVVQMKLTVLREREAVARIVPLISRFANSQNKVNGADFAANGRFHCVLEEMSRSLWAPATSGLERGTHWYYERARGSYSDDVVRQGTPGRQREWKEQNPVSQKFSKTDLAKFEHAWQGLPHLVCKGAEKNFNEYAAGMEEIGEPEVNLEYFQAVVAKAILWKTAEKSFDELELQGYRANSVAYGMACVVNRSGNRVNLDWIWQNQRVPKEATAVLREACRQAHAFLMSQDGNVGESSKKEETWSRFSALDFSVSDEWEKEWASEPYKPPMTLEEALNARWDDLRKHFLDDSRTILGLERYTSQSWNLPARRSHSIARYASLSFDQLRREDKLSVKKIKDLMILLSNAMR